MTNFSPWVNAKFSPAEDKWMDGRASGFDPFLTLKIAVADPRLSDKEHRIVSKAVFATDNASGEVRMSKVRIDRNFQRYENGVISEYLVIRRIHGRKCSMRWRSMRELILMAKHGYPHPSAEVRTDGPEAQELLTQAGFTKWGTPMAPNQGGDPKITHPDEVVPRPEAWTASQ